MPPPHVKSDMHVLTIALFSFHGKKPNFYWKNGCIQGQTKNKSSVKKVSNTNYQKDSNPMTLLLRDMKEYRRTYKKQVWTWEVQA